MNTISTKILIIIFLVGGTSGCGVMDGYTTGLQNAFSFRQDMMEAKQSVRQAEREAQQRELEAVRAAELREIHRSRVEMVPTLSKSLETTINDKIVSMRLVPDYLAMAQAAEAMAKIEKENDRVYQEQLVKWMRDQSEVQRQHAQFASHRPFCRLHGYKGCDCADKEPPGCRQPGPPRLPLKDIPKKPDLPRLPLKYKLEFAVQSEIGSSAFTESRIGRLPLKDRCLPKKQACDCNRSECTNCAPKAPVKQRNGAQSQRPPVPLDSDALDPPRPVPDNTARSPRSNRRVSPDDFSLFKAIDFRTPLDTASRANAADRGGWNTAPAQTFRR